MQTAMLPAPFETDQPKPPRISRKARHAIDLMVREGLKRSEAAAKAGLTDNAMYVSLRRPETLAYMRDQMQVLRTSAAARTIAKAEQLMDGAESEHVQADMTKWLAGLEGLSPTQRIDNIGGSGASIPGLTINFMIAGPARVIEGLAHQSQEPIVINGLPKSVPHPSMRNALPLPEKTEGQARHREGEKP